MANVELTIAGRRYDLACRPGGEPRLRSVAALVDAKASEAARQMGGMSEARQMMFAALMLADELHSEREAAAQAPVPTAPDPAIAATIEALAERLEQLSVAISGASAGGGVEKPGAAA